MKRLIPLLLIQLLSFGAIAATFVVTSNADSGPGTLQQALLDAKSNGTATKDLITFNIADQSESGRTINVALIKLTSNLVIDGTTQPGNKFGVSDAKIKVNNLIKTDDDQLIANNLEIYGLWLIGDRANGGASMGISITKSSNITIGAPGKGNIFNNYLYAVNISESSSVTIQSNIFGLNSDGVSSFKNLIAMECLNINNLTIGGPQANQGNVFADYNGLEIDLTGCENISVSNNLFGTDVTGNKAVSDNSTGPNNTGGINMTSGNSITISNNVFANFGGALTLVYVNTQSYTIQNNKFGTGVSGTGNLGNIQAVLLYQCQARGKIANNIFFYNDKAVEVSDCNPVTITQNVFDCNNQYTNIFYDSGSYNIPKITVDKKSSGQISGTATPNSLIELFYAGNCGCQARTYITAVPADGKGNWSYSANLLPKLILATATGPTGSTSSFSLPAINDDDLILKNATCGNNGALTGTKFINATESYWINADNGSIISRQSNLLNLLPGKYQFIINNGVCSASSKIYEIKDEGVDVDASHAVVTDASCNLPTGSITGIIVTSRAPYFNAAWRNEAGLAISDSVNLLQAKPGKYTLEIIPPGRECLQSFSYTIANISLSIPTPQVNDMVLCTPGDVMIAVNNPAPGYGYHLYEDELSNTPIDEKATGLFKINVKSDRSYYITQYKGSCESNRAKINIKVLSTELHITNTFTPNGDGINDTWRIEGLEKYPDASVQVYSRSGEKLFDSNGYAIPFNGIYNGRQLPAGAYYYIINLKIKADCSVIGGSLTLVR